MVYDVLKVLHTVSFVFMAIPLFNLIVVNERAALGIGFTYPVDRYVENIIGHGAGRCFVFQVSVLVTGLLLLNYGPFGVAGLWTNAIVLIKFILLVVLAGLLSFVHFRLQPRIEEVLKAAADAPGQALPEALTVQLKGARSLRKRMATACLFLVLIIIVLGVQVYGSFSPAVTASLIVLAALFAWRANKTLVRIGWV
jgi:hypothetical protein